MGGRRQLDACYVAGPSDACWPWTWWVDAEGYGRYYHEAAHRVMYLRARGPIPVGLTLDHTCHNRACVGGMSCLHRRCVNPNHLEPVTRFVNNHRGNAPSILAIGNPTCKNGHPKTAENIRRNRVGTWQCRVCNRAAVAKLQARRREAEGR